MIEAESGVAEVTFKCRWSVLNSPILHVGWGLMIVALLVQSFHKHIIDVIGAAFYGLAAVVNAMVLFTIFRTKTLVVHDDSLDFAGDVTNRRDISRIVYSTRRHKLSVYRKSALVITIRSKDAELMDTIKHWAERNHIPLTANDWHEP